MRRAGIGAQALGMQIEVCDAPPLISTANQPRVQDICKTSQAKASGPLNITNPTLTLILKL